MLYKERTLFRIADEIRVVDKVALSYLFRNQDRMYTAREDCGNNCNRKESIVPVVGEQSIGKDKPSLLIAFEIVGPLVKPSFHLGVLVMEAHICHDCEREHGVTATRSQKSVGRSIRRRK